MGEKKYGHLGSVLVIGGNGFLGHHVVQHLVENWETTHVASLDLRCSHLRVEGKGVSYHEADITNTTALGAVFAELKPDVVVHTASPQSQSDSPAANELYYRVNVGGTKAVIAACQKFHVKALVFTSSASVISDNIHDLHNADEEYPVLRAPIQTYYYSETKAEAEDLVLKANRKENVLTCSIRPAGIVGEGDVVIVRNALRVYYQGRNNVQLGENNGIFDFTYAGNIAHAHLLAAQRLLATAERPGNTVPLDHERVDGEAFFITNDQPIYFWDFLRIVWREAGSQKGLESVKTIPFRPALVLGWLSEVFSSLVGRPPTFNRQRVIFANMTRYYDVSKAKLRLGYEPLVGLEEAVKRSVAWSLENDKALHV